MHNNKKRQTNFGDKIYMASCGRRGGCWIGTRRVAVASVNYR